MKVALVGPSSSGKTTLARTLAERLGWRYLTFSPRLMGLDLSPMRGQDPESKFALQREIHRRSKSYLPKLLEEAPPYLCDRPPWIDVFPYWKAYFRAPPEGLEGEWRSYLEEELPEALRFAQEHFDLILLTEPLEFVEDGVRPRVPGIWEAYLEVFGGLPNLKIVPALPLEERVEKALELFEGF